MGRGKRVKTKPERLRLGDSETRTRLAPIFSPREPLRRRFVALAEQPGLRPHERALVEEMEAVVVDEPDLADAEAWLDDLETFNAHQLYAVLFHEAEQVRGERESLEIVCLFEDGTTIVRAHDVADCLALCAELDWPYESPNPEEEEVYFVRDAGTCFALVLGFTSCNENGQPEAFPIHDIRGRFPGVDDPDWNHDTVDDAKEPLARWFADLRAHGIDAYWGEGDAHIAVGVGALTDFYFHHFREAPRRYVDGYDERFGLAGPVSRLETRLTVEQCLKACADEEYLEWTDFADKIADAIYVATVLSGGDAKKIVDRAEVWVAELRKGCASDEEWLERYEAVDSFIRRLRKVDEFVAGDAGVLAGGLPWRL
jgi:hypothetical protein